MTDRRGSNEQEGVEPVDAEAESRTQRDATQPDAHVVAVDAEAPDATDATDVTGEDEDGEDVTADARVERRSDLVIVALVFVVLFGYQLYVAIANLVSLPKMYAAVGQPDAAPWPILIVGVGIPAVLFALAIAVGRGRALVARAGILLLGLGISAQLSLLLEELARQAAAVAFGS